MPTLSSQWLHLFRGIDSSLRNNLKVYEFGHKEKKKHKAFLAYIFPLNKTCVLMTDVVMFMSEMSPRR